MGIYLDGLALTEQAHKPHKSQRNGNIFFVLAYLLNLKTFQFMSKTSAIHFVIKLFGWLKVDVLGEYQ